MLFIVALIIAIIFVAVFKELLKKYPDIFYITAAVISIAAFVCSSYVTMTGWVRDYVAGIFAKGSLGTAFFVLVMYAGAMKNTWKATKTLMRIRGELSIMGCVLVLCHNATYGRIYFRMLFTSPNILSATQMTAAVISLVLITIMLILTVTSFPQVRNKMNAVKWKKLQRTAYIFYGLIYVHILLINVPYARRGMSDYAINVAVYSLVFVNYAMMRIHKAAVKKVKKITCSDEKKNVYAVSLKVGLTVAGLIVIVGAMFMCFAGIDNNDNTEQDKVYAQLTDNNQNNNDNKVLTEQDKTEKSTEAVTQESTDKENDSTKAETEADKEKEDTTTDNKEQSADTQVDNAQPVNVSDAGSSDSDTSDSGNSGSDASDSKDEEKVTPTEAKRKFKADGTYSATVKCQRYNYMVTVQVVIASDTITQVTATPATSDASDLMYFNMAADVIPSKLISAQGSSGVDTVSGATYSSKAIISGFNSAIN